MRTGFVAVVVAVGVVVGLVGCGSEDDRQVASLSAEDQEAVCADFVTTICANPEVADFCDACVTTTGCASATAQGAITAECGGAAMATVAMVEECAATADFAVCMQGGGCMFDAIELVCP